MRSRRRTQADGRSSSQVFAEGRLKVIASGVERFDWEFQPPGGETLLLDVILHAVQMGGGQIVHGILRDVTAQRLAAREVDIARLAAESSLRHLSRQDALTGLPNRSLFLDEGQRRLDAIARAAIASACSCIDVDNFRGLNDALGEAVGDGVLRAVGERLRRFAGPADLLARLGSDEFALLLTDCSADAAGRDRPPPDCSAGTAAHDRRASIERDRRRRHCLSRRAGAKPRGLDAAGVDRDERRVARAGVAVGGCFPKRCAPACAIAGSSKANCAWRWSSGNSCLHYQPQVELQSNRIVGVEALLRWHNPRLGFLEPVRFIALAEEAGLIESIGEWMLFQACRQSGRWLAKGLTPVRMSVNVVASPVQARPPRAGRTGARRGAPRRRNG